MPFGVVLTDDALRDLDDTCGYIAQHDTSKSAAYVLERIEKALVDLAEFPERGRHPRELADLGITEFREIFFKPYRLVYRVEQRRSEEHTSELQSLMRNSYAVFCLKKKKPSVSCYINAIQCYNKLRNTTTDARHYKIIELT